MRRKQQVLPLQHVEDLVGVHPRVRAFPVVSSPLGVFPAENKLGALLGRTTKVLDPARGG